MRDQNLRGRARDSRHIVVLGVPESRVAEAIDGLRELRGVAERSNARTSAYQRDEVERRDGKSHNVTSLDGQSCDNPNHMKPMVTERLTIRPFTLDDAAFIITLVNDSDWLRFIGDKAVKTEEDARRYLTAGPIAMYELHGFGLCAIERNQRSSDDWNVWLDPARRSGGRGYRLCLGAGSTRAGLRTGSSTGSSRTWANHTAYPQDRGDHRSRQRCVNARARRVGMRFERHLHIGEGAKRVALYAVDAEAFDAANDVGMATRSSMPRHSAVIFASRITLPHLAVSVPINDSNSAGVLPTGIVPISSNFCLTSGSFTMAATSSATRLMTAGGVPAGAKIPAHVLPVKLDALLDEGRNVGQRRQTRFARDPDQSHLAGLPGLIKPTAASMNNWM